MSDRVRVRRRWSALAAAAMLPVLAVTLAPAAGRAQDNKDSFVDRTDPGLPIRPRRPGAPAHADDFAVTGTVAVGPLEEQTEALLHTPITGIFPGGVKPDAAVANPVADDPGAAFRGMGYFNQFNCVGCHAPNGAGGMGPSLSNALFQYGGKPQDIYLTILQGRPAGMPAFGAMLPDSVIWDLVAYVTSISNDRHEGWGTTTSLENYTIEQVPAAYMTTVDPWSRTQPFSFGMPPFKKVKRPTEAGKDLAPPRPEGQQE